jgi:5-methylcytosine-specific restriction protein B
MSKLNKIFYGPAGTGKTRRAIKESIKIVQESNDKYTLGLLDYDTSSYEKAMTFFKVVSNMQRLDDSFDKLDSTKKKLLNDINDLNKDVDSIVGDRKYIGYLMDLENPKNHILKYRLYPLIEIVTFHPSYSYQDFVEGITVKTNEDGSIEYFVKDGIFKRICKRAIDNPNYNYVLVIDEINRGDISSIFGELFTLLEESKRKNKNEELTINLPYSKDKKGNPEKLSVPDNLYVLATMNTVDKSIALIDVALRRRFDFIECMPDYSIDELKTYNDVNIPALLRVLNKRVCILKNEHYQIGHSYFMNINNFDELKGVLKKSIIPLLQEYFYDDWQSICAVLNQPYKGASMIKNLLVIEKPSKSIFREEFDDLIEYANTKILKINKDFTKQDVINIYT